MKDPDDYILNHAERTTFYPINEFIKNKLVNESHAACWQLRKRLYDDKILFFESNKGIFAKEIVHRSLGECLAYLGCIAEGSFFPAAHHSRSLIETYCDVCFVSKKKEMLDRYIRFIEIERYRFYHSSKQSIFANCNQINPKIYFDKPPELAEDLYKIFGKKTKEDLLKIRHWRGSSTIENTFLYTDDEMLHKMNYNMLSLSTHLI